MASGQVLSFVSRMGQTRKDGKAVGAIHFGVVRKMDINAVGRCAEALEAVRRSGKQGLLEWRYHGRLVARQLDAERIVIRAEFGYRDALVRQSPETFSAPGRFAKHMMVVVDLEHGRADLIEDAIEAAWQLQRASD